jgi:hypothetical protein
MPLPNSFIQAGFLPPEQAVKVDKKGVARKFRRLMIGTEGDTDSGKSEFIMSAPDPGMIIALDRSFDGTLTNPQPPKSRRPGFGINVVAAPLATQSNKAMYAEYWKEFYTRLVAASENPDCRTLAIDGDSDSWELQQLAEWGVLTGVPGPPGLVYAGVNAARRAMISRLWDSGKIIIATNKLHDEYLTARDDNGNPVLDKTTNKEVRVRTGKRERQGFKDQDYLWQIQLRHLYSPAHIAKRLGKDVEVPPRWGIRILKCKSNKALEGSELWGDDCNFKGLVSFIYPNVPLTEWGFPANEK